MLGCLRQYIRYMPTCCALNLTHFKVYSGADLAPIQRRFQVVTSDSLPPPPPEEVAAEV